MDANVFSIITLFTGSDIVTMVDSYIMLFASIWCWAIILEKTLSIRLLKTANGFFEKAFWSGGDLSELFANIERYRSSPKAQVFSAAMGEWKKSSSILKSKRLGERQSAGLLARIERAMGNAIDAQHEKITRRMSFLAATATVAPFLGLFGTVWGVMESFSALGATASASIAVVGPGIAKALGTTVIGLLAAIPAAVFHNIFQEQIDTIDADMAAFGADFSSIISRQIDGGIAE